MTVALLPPTTYGYGQWNGIDRPLLEGPRYVRGSGHSRWHRLRSAVRRPRWTSLDLWCGQATQLERVITAEQVPEADPVCGTCEGRALGAGQDETPAGMPRLAFEPRWLEPPAKCPGAGRSRNFEAVGRVGRCLICRELLPVRATGSWHNPDYGVVSHQPGPGLAPPCPWHGWRRLYATEGGSIRCGCGYPPEATNAD